MKRIFFILLFFGAFLMCACEKNYGILEYQSRDITARCTVNGKFEIELVKKDGTCTLRVISPKEIEGIAFEMGQNACVLINGERASIEKEELKGICALSEMFSQSEECMTSAYAQGEESVLTFQKDECVYRVTLGKNSLPKRVHILCEGFEYNVEIMAIEMK